MTAEAVRAELESIVQQVRAHEWTSERICKGGNIPIGSAATKWLACQHSQNRRVNNVNSTSTTKS